jgi:flagellar hook-associated protein FlgK
VKALDEATLNERLKPWLSGKNAVKDLLERRDSIVEKLEELAHERGGAAVLLP